MPDRLFAELERARVSPELARFADVLIPGLELPEEITVSQWADKYRTLSRKESPHAHGPWRTDLVPYLKRPMDAFTQPTVERITLVSATRMGKTELLKNCFCYVVDQQPINMLIVMPDKVLGKDFAADQIRPLFHTCPRLQGQIPELAAGEGRRRALSTWKFDLRDMTVWVAYASSASTLSARTIAVLLLDEIRGFPASASGEGSPLDLARERTETFDRGEFKVVEVSSPGIAGDALDLSWKHSDREEYHVPCPHCGAHQVLEFEQIKLPASELEAPKPDRIREERLAHYECIRCQKHLPDEPIERKREIVRDGLWVPEAGTIEKVTHGEAPATYRVVRTSEGPDRPGRVAGAPEWPRHVGFRISRLYSPWPRHTWSEIAARSIESDPKTGGTTESRQVFVTTWLARAYEEQFEAVTPADLRRKTAGHVAGTVPDGARVLTGFVDVQLDHCYFVIRAWGEHWRSWLVRIGTVDTFEELEDCMAKNYPSETMERSFRTAAVGIDVRYRGGEVMHFCRAQNTKRRGAGPFFIPCSGREHVFGGHKRGSTQKDPLTGRKIRRSEVVMLDTNEYKDKLKRFIDAAGHEEGEWHLYENVSPRYLSHMCSEEKVPSRNPRTGRIKLTWRQKTKHNHYWDCEVGALAIADILRVGEPDTPEPPKTDRRSAKPSPPLVKRREFKREY